MKNKREDRFEAIVDQFVKNDLIAQEEYSYYLYAVCISSVGVLCGRVQIR